MPNKEVEKLRRCSHDCIHVVGTRGGSMRSWTLERWFLEMIVEGGLPGMWFLKVVISELAVFIDGVCSQS